MLNPDLTYRQIWMDGRALEPEPNPAWMGCFAGRWELQIVLAREASLVDGAALAAL
jgi:hypothetical protein